MSYCRYQRNIRIEAAARLLVPVSGANPTKYSASPFSKRGYYNGLLNRTTLRHPHLRGATLRNPFSDRTSTRRRDCLLASDDISYTTSVRPGAKRWRASCRGRGCSCILQAFVACAAGSPLLATRHSDVRHRGPRADLSSNRYNMPSDGTFDGATPCRAPTVAAVHADIHAGPIIHRRNGGRLIGRRRRHTSLVHSQARLGDHSRFTSASAIPGAL